MQMTAFQPLRFDVFTGALSMRDCSLIKKERHRAALPPCPWMQRKRVPSTRSASIRMHRG